jgi:hypothetical protein
MEAMANQQVGARQRGSWNHVGRCRSRTLCNGGLLFDYVELIDRKLWIR